MERTLAPHVLSRVSLLVQLLLVLFEWGMATKTPQKKSKATTKAGSKKPTARKTAKVNKKVTTKRAAGTKKKTAAKSSKVSQSPKVARRMPVLHVDDPSLSFWVNCGPVIDSLDGLAAALQEMSDDQYSYHAQGEANDFARWVGEVFGEASLAQKIARARSRSGARRVVVAHVSLYK